MKVGYVEAVGGAAGDMLIGACLAAGLDLDDLRLAVGRLRLEGYALSAARVDRAGVRATKFAVTLRNPVHSHVTHHRHGDGPSIDDIHARLEGSSLPAPVIAAAGRVFDCLAIGTGSVEGLSASEVRFDEHDVVDTYIDIVGTTYGLWRLGVERLFTSALPIGPASLHVGQRVIRLPHPVTVTILRAAAMPTRDEHTEGEQVTPTGAAILATLADGGKPEMQVTKRGAGAGDAELEVPNVVRLEIGEMDGDGV